MPAMRGLARHLIGSNESNVGGGSSGDLPFVECLISCLGCPLRSTPHSNPRVGDLAFFHRAERSSIGRFQ
jgi:hypothetical protein